MPTPQTLISDEDRAIIEKGIRMEALLNHTYFAEVVNSLSDEYANRIITTSWDAVAEREDLYRRHHALMDIVAHVKEAIRLRADTEARLQAEETLAGHTEDNF
jgi:hypothetical protein